MDDISAAALDALLHYLYGGCSRLQPAITIELFAVADKYGISGLKAECILNMQQCLEVSCSSSLSKRHGHYSCCCPRAESDGKAAVASATCASQVFHWQSS
jgi:hypothetical protein